MQGAKFERRARTWTVDWPATRAMLGARCEVRSAKCKVQGARCKVQGARCEVREPCSYRSSRITNVFLNLEDTWIVCTGQYKCEVLRGIIGSLHKIRNFTDVVDRFVLTMRGDR